MLICYVQMKTFSYRYYEEQLKPMFDIQLRGCYLFRGMPFLRVTFIDGCKAQDFVMQDAQRQSVVLAKRLELSYVDPITGGTLFVSGRITEPVSPTCCSNVVVTSFVAFHLVHFIFKRNRCSYPFLCSVVCRLSHWCSLLSTFDGCA